MLEISILINKQINQMTTILNEYINDVVATKLTDHVSDKFTEEEEQDYYASGDYEVHLNYLIETWVSTIESEINYDGTFEFISISEYYFVDGLYCPDFNNEWLDDIFERHILDRVVLK